MPCSKLWGAIRFLDTLSKEELDSLIAELEKCLGGHPMCNNCIHKPVCSKYIAMGEVNSCEHHYVRPSVFTSTSKEVKDYIDREACDTE